MRRTRLGSRQRWGSDFVSRFCRRPPLWPVQYNRGHPLSESLPPHPSPTPAFVRRHDSDGQRQEYKSERLASRRLHLSRSSPYPIYPIYTYNTALLASSHDFHHRYIAHIHTSRSLVAARSARKSDESPGTCPVHVDFSFPHVQPRPFASPSQRGPGNGERNR